MFRIFLNKNAIWAGLVAGIVLPFIGYAVFMLIFEQLESWGISNDDGLGELFRERTSLVVAICLNLILMRYYRKKMYYQSMRGIIFATLIGAALWMILFFNTLF